jgi:hypothetical protein
MRAYSLDLRQKVVAAVERGDSTIEELRLQFEAISKFDADEKKVIRSLLDGMILKHEAKRWSSSK